MSAPQPELPEVPQPRYTLLLLALVFPVLTAVALALAYPSLPAEIPVHFTASGEADRYAETTWLSVLMLPLVTVLLTLLLGATGLIQQAALKPQSVTAGPDEGVALPWSNSLYSRTHLIMGVSNRWMAWMTAGLSLGMSAMALGSVLPDMQVWMTVGTVLVLGSVTIGVIAGLALSFRAMGRARKIEADEQELERQRILKVRENFEAVNRAGGLIYSNPADPMLMVPSGFQEGNVNFNVAHAPARRFWWLFLGSVVLIILLPILEFL